jgi:2,3-bisphosphoglycerate-dependent phosphoglycerate mutase
MERLRILLVRHAEPVVATLDGPAEPLRPLTERGHRQAEALAEELCAARPHTIVSSPYRRALDTVRPAADRIGLGIELLDDLCEWRSGLRPPRSACRSGVSGRGLPPEWPRDRVTGSR